MRRQSFSILLVMSTLTAPAVFGPGVRAEEAPEASPSPVAMAESTAPESTVPPTASEPAASAPAATPQPAETTPNQNAAGPNQGSAAPGQNSTATNQEPAAPNAEPTPAEAAASETAAPVASAEAGAPAAPETANEPNVRVVTAAYNSGLAAVKANDIAAAAQHLEKAVALAPNDAMAQMLLGYVRLKQENYDGALTALEAAARLDSQLDTRSRAIVQNNIGMAYWNKKQLQNALQFYEKAVAIDSTYADGRYNLAFALLALSRSKDAIPHFTTLLERNPRDPMLHDGLGQSYEGIGDWEKAFASYRRAIALNPKDSSYPLNMGLALLRSDPEDKVPGRRDLAISFLRTAATLNPQNGPAHLHMGLSFLEKKRWADAQASLSRYVALRPDDFVGLFNLALAYDYDARFDDALRVYAQAEALQPRDPSIKNNVGRIHLKRERFDDAITQFKRALQIDPNFLDARHNLALTLTAKAQATGGNLNDANAEWNRLIASASDQLKKPLERDERAEVVVRLASARAALAENYLKANNYAEAAIEYRLLLRLVPNNIEAMSNLGLALYHSQQYAEALKLYDAIVQRDPKNAIAHNNRGVVLEAMNKRADALTSYRRAVEIKPDYSEAKSNRDRLIAGTAVG
jgi:tetratricopeptide (TPR) repeat protein